MCVSHNNTEPPTVKIGLSEEDKQAHFTFNNTEGDVPPDFFCFYTGFSTPNMSWTLATGDTLPIGVNQNFSKPGVLQLHFTAPLAYDDMVTFVCTATYSFAVTNATLELIITGDCVFSFLYYNKTNIHNNNITTLQTVYGIG